MSRSQTLPPAVARPRRADERVRVDLPVAIIVQDGRIQLASRDISLRGIFVRSDFSRWRVNELVQLELGLDPPIRVFARVIRVVAPGNKEGRPAGLGLQFHVAHPDARKRWEELVRFRLVTLAGS